jgi:vancomycin permeability regulator SanA
VGDAFNADDIVARHAGFSTEESVVKASSLASVVIGLAGAIIPTSRILLI